MWCLLEGFSKSREKGWGLTGASAVSQLQRNMKKVYIMLVLGNFLGLLFGKSKRKVPFALPYLCLAFKKTAWIHRPISQGRRYVLMKI